MHFISLSSFYTPIVVPLGALHCFPLLHASSIPTLIFENQANERFLLLLITGFHLKNDFLTDVSLSIELAGHFDLTFSSLLYYILTLSSHTIINDIGGMGMRYSVQSWMGCLGLSHNWG